MEGFVYVNDGDLLLCSVVPCSPRGHCGQRPVGAGIDGGMHKQKASYLFETHTKWRQCR
jgi:hypothetical protein